MSGFLAHQRKQSNNQFRCAQDCQSVILDIRLKIPCSAQPNEKPLESKQLKGFLRRGPDFHPLFCNMLLLWDFFVENNDYLQQLFDFFNDEQKVYFSCKPINLSQGCFSNIRNNRYYFPFNIIQNILQITLPVIHVDLKTMHPVFHLYTPE